MNADALRELLKIKPFEPFELILSSGDRYQVWHPEMILILKNRVLVALEPDLVDDDPDKYATISYLHIAGAVPVKEDKRQKLPHGLSR